MGISIEGDKGDRNKKSFLTALSSVALTISNGLLGVVVTRMILVQFGSDFNGLNSSANQIVNMMLILEGGFTLASNVALFSPLNRCDIATVNGILSATKKQFCKIGLTFGVVGIVVSLVYAEVVNSSLERQLIFTIIIMAIIPQVVNLFFVCKYRVLIQAEQKEYIIALFTLVTTCIGHLINIVTIPIFKEMWIIRFVTMFFAVINGVVIILYAKKQYKWISFQVDERYDLIVGTRDVLLQKITGVIYSSAPIIFLSIYPMGGTKVASVYAVYNSIFLIVKGILHGIIDAPKQGIGQLFKEADKNRIWDVFEQYEYIAIFTIFCFITTMFVMIIPFVTLYTVDVDDISYTDFGIALLMVNITIVELLHIPSGQLINMSGKFDIVKNIQVLATGLIIFSMPIFGYWFGVYGFLIAVLMTAILLAVLEMGYVHIKMFDDKLLNLLRIIIPLIIAGVAICFIEGKLGINANGYISLLVYSVIVFIGNLLIGIAIGLLFNRREIIGVLNRLKNMCLGGR